jgi:organic hydroperoxide reductase OsmC/OhrA
MDDHTYAIDLVWQGNTGNGTADYTSYGRQFRITAADKPAIVGSADPTFRGDPTRHNPEDLLVAALSSCHMLAYLALCARRHVRVVDYRDAATGRMRTTRDGAGRFEEVVLRPRVTIASSDDLEVARAMHEQAHAGCFIASSVAFPVRVEAIVEWGVARAPHARKDLEVRLPDRPGALAEFGEVVARAGASLEGGGGCVVDGRGIFHFLVAGADDVAAALRDAGCDVVGVRDVITVRLAQNKPGQLGKLARAMADAGVSIECVYSDHDHELVLCVDDRAAAQRVVSAWRG